MSRHCAGCSIPESDNAHTSPFALRNEEWVCKSCAFHADAHADDAETLAKFGAEVRETAPSVFAVVDLSSGAEGSIIASGNTAEEAASKAAKAIMAWCPAAQDFEAE